MIEDVVQFIDYLVRLSRETQGQVSDERLFRILQFGVASYGELAAARCGCTCGASSSVNNVGPDRVGRCVDRQVTAIEAAGPDEESGEGFERVGSGQRGCAESGRCGDVGLVDAPVRGPNYERNKANRDVKKRRKAMRKSLGVDWRRGKVNRAGCVDENGAKRDVGNGNRCVDSEKKGFWNSCSDDVRQQLIDSKARMHIARNEEEVRKCKAAQAKEDSPETLLRNIFRIIELGEKKAKEVNNVKVSSWMGSVAAGCAETMASSAPSSLPSFQELTEKLAASSQSSFDLTLQAKDDEINELRDALRVQKEAGAVKDQELQELIDELRLSETMANNRFACLSSSVGKSKVGKVSGVKFFTPEQQKSHRQLTVRDIGSHGY